MLHKSSSLYVSSALALLIPALLTLTSCSGVSSSGNQAASDGSGSAAKAMPTITWAAPAPISASTPLSAVQLNATANVPGGFSYTPAAGTTLATGNQTLTATFTPTDTSVYSTATASVVITVNPSPVSPTKSVPTITWAPPAPITNPTPLSAMQLDATANVAGTFLYTPPAGTVLSAGTQTLSVTFTPTDTTDYISVNAIVPITVNQPLAQPAFLVTAENTNSGTSVSNGVYGLYSVDASGVVTPKSTFPMGGGAPWWMALHPNGQWIYTADGQCCPEVESPFAEVLAVDSGNGTLSPIAGSPFSEGSYANMLAIHPSGQFVYYSSSAPGSLHGMIGFSIGANGAPTALPGSPFSTEAVGGSGMAITPDGRFLFAVPQQTQGNNQVYTFSIASSGALTQIGVTNVNTSATSDPFINEVLVAPSGNNIFVASGSAVAVFSLNQQTGQLTPVSGSPFVVAGQLTSFALSPGGQYLYVAECLTSTGSQPLCQAQIQTYAVDANAGPITAEGTPQLLGPSYAAPLVTAAGSLVFAATTPTSTLNSGGTGYDYTGTISTFSVDSDTGALTLLTSDATVGSPGLLLLPVP
jgi:6-phosphogluconolactonase (cycloisomerase 2 family)